MTFFTISPLPHSLIVERMKVRGILIDPYPIVNYSWNFNSKKGRIIIMTSLTFSTNFRRWTKEIGHAVAILILTISLSIFLGDFTFLKGSEALYKGLFRFLRITVLLCLSLYLLFPTTVSLLIPTGQFQPGRFLIVTGITIVISFHNHFLQKRGKTLIYNLLKHQGDFRNE